MAIVGKGKKEKKSKPLAGGGRGTNAGIMELNLTGNKELAS